MKRAICLAIAGATTALAVTAASAQPVPVSGTTSSAQAIGSLGAGLGYTITASGVVRLCGACNGSGALEFKPDGTVATTAQPPYAAFNSGPKDYDPAGGMSSFGFYGQGVNFGALYGSFTPTPTAADLFLIGTAPRSPPPAPRARCTA